MSTDNALSYVGPIMTAYNAAEKAGRDALSHALECGKHLRAAMMTVTAAKRKWKTWREANLPSVSEETERLYRRLADAVAIKEDFFTKCKSVRDAMKHLAEYDPKTLELKPERQSRQKSKTGNGVTALQPPEADTPSTGLEAELENAAADEIIGCIDADKLEEGARASVAKLSPDKVCEVLTSAWSADQVRDLITKLNLFVSKSELRSSRFAMPGPAERRV